MEFAKVELDNTPLCGICLVYHSASHTAYTLPQYVSKESLEEVVSVFGQEGRALVIMDDQGRPSGKSAAQKAMDRVYDVFFKLTTFPSPVTVDQWT